MVATPIQLLWFCRSLFASRTRLEAENLLLRQQLIVLRRHRLGRVRLRNRDRLVLVWLYRLFPTLLDAILIVQPETILRWQRRGLRAYWRWQSRKVGGRPRIDGEIRKLIRRMSHDNPLWGAPRIHRELLMLGIEVAESTVSKDMGDADHHRKAGRLSCAITRRASPRWTCSWCARFPSSSSMAW